ncbi:MAG: peptidylprolyl isomerase [Anaerolineales bacterium]|nr:peptidylprolyl isomerase [Anaerolineales bacterium]
MTLDADMNYFATVKLAKGGEFTLELFADRAPLAVNNFVFLARDGFYNGVTFHRVIDGFMAQGGDPTGSGSGGPGYSFADEFESGLKFDKPGLLAMANAGPNTNGSQFFITFDQTPWLDGLHTIFGQVVEGMDVVNEIARREPGSATPGDIIETITITEEPKAK